MVKLTFPLSVISTGGALYNWFYNNAMIRSNVIKTADDINAYAENGFDLTYTQINNLLANGGEVEGLLMAVRTTIAVMDDTVPATLPNRLLIEGSVKSFKHWLVPGAEVWRKDDNSEVIFYTNPFALNQSGYLTGSQIKIIKDIGPSVQIIKVSEAEVITATGWQKL